ncbi:hypothetical protein VJJ74_04915 [Parvimonas micra]|uniref:hypothetical protein n=1 Tax=Parvimonas micra TaxID=33033 RepID=UPI002B498DAF|nr:hypothetical protein [Parvimonas micra]MEB3060483.1 hypothetical protein [Parvimonas micra]MEB3066340.1 hypothetical protein [Parvimonas micra]
MKKIKFHSIYYRFTLFILTFAILVINMIIADKNAIIQFSNFNLKLWQLNYIFIGIFIAITLIFSFIGWKFYVCKEGIYLRKIDLLVPWEDVDAVSHVWINEWSRRPYGRQYFYNRKSLVIYRNNYKPICIYNISLLALYTIKILKPSIKTNIIVATLATIFNMAVNFGIIYYVFSRKLEFIKIELFLSYIVIYMIKMTLVPLVMVKYENIKHGKYLFHDNAYNKNSSKVIQL